MIMPLHKVMLRAAAPCSSSPNALAASAAVTCRLPGSSTTSSIFSTGRRGINTRSGPATALSSGTKSSAGQYDAGTVSYWSTRYSAVSVRNGRAKEKKIQSMSSQVRASSTNAHSNINSPSFSLSRSARLSHSRHHLPRHSSQHPTLTTITPAYCHHPSTITHRASFSTSPPNLFPPASSAPPSSPAPISADTYHKLADSYIDTLLEALEEQLAELRDDVDVEYSSGVLKLVVPPQGTYVINKQPPNQQIWLSSPISGPKRYDWVAGAAEDGQEGAWVYLRDGSTLTGLLKEELELDTEALESLYR